MARNNNQQQEFTQKIDPKWITHQIDKGCIKFMDALGFYLCDKRTKEDNFPGYNAMTSSQIRNIFSELKRLEAKLVEGLDTTKKEESTSAEKWKKVEPEFLMLRPKIAYNAAREIQKRRDSRIKAFRKTFEDAHAEVDNTKQFKNFVRLFEGILAYHKVYGGK